VKPERLQQIRERLNNTTPGEWKLLRRGEGQLNSSFNRVVADGEDLSHRHVCNDEDFYPAAVTIPDQTFIANAKQDITDLLDWTKRLETLFTADFLQDSPAARTAYLMGMKKVVELLYEQGVSYSMAAYSNAADLIHKYADRMENR